MNRSTHVGSSLAAESSVHSVFSSFPLEHTNTAYSPLPHPNRSIFLFASQQIRNRYLGGRGFILRKHCAAESGFLLTPDLSFSPLIRPAPLCAAPLCPCERVTTLTTFAAPEPGPWTRRSAL